MLLEMVFRKNRWYFSGRDEKEHFKGEERAGERLGGNSRRGLEDKSWKSFLSWRFKSRIILLEGITNID